MKEYKVKICEVRYEYIEANSPCEAIRKAERMSITNADEIKCEIVGDEPEELISRRDLWTVSTTGLSEHWTGTDICSGDDE